MKTYISGPMSGIPEKEYIRNFTRAEKKLLEMGRVPINPIFIGEYPLSYEEIMKLDLELLKMCDSIYLLKGWRESKGALLEATYAMVLKKEIIYEELPQADCKSCDRLDLECYEQCKKDDA